MALRPAHETKHIPLLQYPFRTHTFHLTQLDNGATNGTGLWLGAQCLSLYLSDLFRLRNKSTSPSCLSAGAQRPNTVIELGSGIGLSALVLASMGWDVIATDLQDVISAVLSPNISRNRANLPAGSGAIEVRVLDWTVPPDIWLWNNPNVIASQHPSPPAHSAREAATLHPPFDLIVSSDTLYLAELVTPLMRSLHEVSRLSVSTSPEARAPPIYLCVERRDPGMMDRALSEAKEVWNFKVERVPHKRLAKAMEKGGARWGKGEWDDVEIWKLVLQA